MRRHLSCMAGLFAYLWTISFPLCTSAEDHFAKKGPPAPLLKSVTGQYETFEGSERAAFDEFLRRAAAKWGKGNVWVPDPKVWVQYESDLGERSAVDFEKGVGRIQLLIRAADDPFSDQVKAHLEQGVRNLVSGEPEDPIEMIRGQKPLDRIKGKGMPSGTHHESSEGSGIYEVRKGDSLWKIGEKYNTTSAIIARMNSLSADATLHIGQRLLVPEPSTHFLEPDEKPRPAALHPLLLGQIRMRDGRLVTRDILPDYARELVQSRDLRAKKIRGADGRERLAVTLEFRLIPEHLEVRARRYRPLVQDNAGKHGIYPPLVFAVIHTESAFNPRARSGTPAYGLMQLVPRGGARDAHRMLHGTDRVFTPKYLYDPKNNIGLGTAYLHILAHRYMKAIHDPASRMYCVIAAYNAGASNVGYALIGTRSMRKAIPAVNRMEPEAVYVKLHQSLPFKESRSYVKKIRDRIPLYASWK
jgi:LysM repeat protein